VQGLVTVAMNTGDQAFAALRGLFNIMVTPFDAGGSFDPRAFADTAERMIALGYDGLLVGGRLRLFCASDLQMPGPLVVRPLLRMAPDMQDTGDARGQAPERAA
jgi:hypothetical protein